MEDNLADYLKRREERRRRNRHRRWTAYLAVALSLLVILSGAVVVKDNYMPPTIPPTERTYESALSANETTLLAERNLTNVWKNASYLVDGLGEKITGGPQEWKGQQYVYNAMNNLSLDHVEWMTYNTSSSNHTGDRITVVGPSTNIPCTIYGYSHGIWGYEGGVYYSFGNMSGGTVLQAQLIDAGYGTKAEFDALGASVVGKIALVHRWDALTVWTTTVNDEAYLHGALATISYDYGDGGTAADPAGIKQDDMSGTIPFFSISIDSANSLKTLLGGGPVTLRLEGRADLIAYGTVQSSNVIGYIYGSVYPDEYVVISSHIDTFWNGSFDTCSGIACMLEFARIFSEAKGAGTFTNERTLVFVSAGSEESGGPDETWFSWLVGTYEMYLAHPEIMDGLVMDLNMDGPGLAKSSGQYWAEISFELQDLFNQVTSDLGHTGSVGCYTPLYSWTDTWIYGAKAGSSGCNLWWVNDYDPYYHTNLDDMDLYSNVSIDLTLEFYIVMAARASNSLVHPGNLLSTLTWIQTSISSGKTAIPYKGPWFDNVTAAITRLSENVTLMNAYAAQLQIDYNSATNDSQRAAVKWKADWLNDAYREARRWINRWGYGEGGTMSSWDTFVRPNQHVNDLNYVDVAIDKFGKGTPSSRTQGLTALTSVYTMEWGNLFSNWTYHNTYQWMYNPTMYWGSVWDQQQAYIDIWWIWNGVTNGSVSQANAIIALTAVKNNLLLPWLHTDLLVMENAFDNASATIQAGMSPSPIPEAPVMFMVVCIAVAVLAVQRKKKRKAG